MKRVIIAFLVMMILSIPLSAKEESKLKEFEKEVNKPVESSSDSESSNGFDNSDYDTGDDTFFDSDDDDDDECGFFCMIFRAILNELFFGGAEQLRYYEFQDYPYKNDYGRYTDMGKSMDFQIDTNYFYHSSKLDGHFISTSFCVTPFLDINGKYCEFNEIYDEDESYQLKFADLYLDYIRFRGPLGSWSWGVGAKYMDGSKKHLGFSGNSEIEIFPVKPLSVNLSGSLSGLNKHLVTEWRGEVAVHAWKVRLSTGYYQLKTGSESINGLILGAGINF